MKGKIFNSQKRFDQQYLQQFLGCDTGKDISQNLFSKYRHKKTGIIIEAEYAKAYHGQWLYWVKNPVEREHKIMSPEWFNEEYEIFKEENKEEARGASIIFLKSDIKRISALLPKKKKGFFNNKSE